MAATARFRFDGSDPIFAEWFPEGRHQHGLDSRPVNHTVAYLHESTALCPDHRKEYVALTDEKHEHFSPSYRIACGIDFHGGDLPDGPAQTDMGLAGCVIACQERPKCIAVNFARSEPGARTGHCYFKKHVSFLNVNEDIVGAVRRPDKRPVAALETKQPFAEEIVGR